MTVSKHRSLQVIYAAYLFASFMYTWLYHGSQCGVQRINWHLLPASGGREGGSHAWHMSVPQL